MFQNLKITTKFLAITVAAFLAATVLSLYVIGTAAKRVIVKDTQDVVAHSFRLQIEDHILPADFVSGDPALAQIKFSSFFEHVRNSTIQRIRVWDAESRTVYAEDPSLVGKSGKDNPLLQDALMGKIGSKTVLAPKVEIFGPRPEMLVIYVPADYYDGDYVAGVMEVHYDLETVNNLIFEMQSLIMALAAAGMTLLSSFLWMLFVTTVRNPVNLIMNAALAIARGNLKARVKIKSKDEIGLVSESFNTMAATVEKFQTSMEENVKEKTADLTEKVSDLENSRLAMMNILTDLDAAYEVLELESAQEQAILEGIGDALIEIEQEGRILFVNKSAMDFFGWKSPDEVMGKFYHQTLQLEDSREELVPIGERPTTICLKTGKSVRIISPFIYYYRRRDGTRFPASITVSPVILKGKQIGAIIAIRDISIEEEIDRAKNEFVSIASHQLRTPLSTISWYAEMLLAGDLGKVSKNQKSYLEEIYGSNRRMIELVNSLLNVSRIEMGMFAINPEPISLSRILDDVHSDLLPLLKKKKIKYSKQYKHLPPMVADPGLMRVVFQNLLTNAVLYTPSGGSVSVNMEAKDDTMLITFADTGYGIPKKDHSKIFTKFFRADNIRVKQPSGTGLGLYIVKSIVEGSGGKIWFESEENKGTKFFISLPIVSKKLEGTRSIT